MQWFDGVISVGHRWDAPEALFTAGVTHRAADSTVRIT